MKNPFRKMLELLDETGADRLLANYAWETGTPSPCGCIFGTLTHHAIPEFEPNGFFRHSMSDMFREWSESLGLTPEDIRDLEMFNDNFANEELEWEKEENGEDDISLIDYEKFSKDRYAVVVEYLMRHAAAFDEAHPKETE
jgi:hypothetical protein